MSCLYVAKNLMEVELVPTVACTVLGRVEVADGIATLTYCHERTIGGLLTAIPQMIAVLPTLCIVRNGAILRAALKRVSDPVVASAADMVLRVH